MDYYSLSEDGHDLSTLIKDFEKSYFYGRYHDYRFLAGLIKQRGDDVKLANHLGIDCATFQAILTNNLIVAECLELIWDDDDAYEVWDQLRLRFLALHTTVSISSSGITLEEVHLRLNVVHNYLFWCLFNPKSLLGNDKDFEVRFEVVVNGLEMALHFFHKPCCWGETDKIQTILVRLMELTCTHGLLHSTDGIYNIGLQLMEIFFHTIHLIYLIYCHNGLDKISMKKCVKIIEAIYSIRPSLKVCSQNYCNKNNDLSVSLFKFGIQRINDRVGGSDIETVLKTLYLSGSLCHLKLKNYKQSIMLLKRPISSYIENLSLISNYLRSYIYYIESDFEPSLFFIKKVLSTPLAKNMKARSHLLYGLLLSNEGKFVEAERVFLKVQEVESYLPIAIYYSAYNYSKYPQPDDPPREISMNNNGESSEDKNTSRRMVKMLVVALEALVHALHHSPSIIKIDYGYHLCLDLKLLSILHQQPDITLDHAIYHLGRALAANGRFSDSADKLLYLIDPSHDHSGQQFGLLLFPPVPSIKTLMHDTITMLIKSERWVEAETVYETSLPTFGTPCDKLILHMFLAKIQLNKNNQADAIKTLLDSLNYKSQMSECPHHSELEMEDEDLASKLAAKVLLEMALIYVDQQRLGGAESHLGMALQQNKKDKDALYHYLLLTKDKIAISHPTWELQRDTLNNVDKRFNSLTLNFLLQQQISQEKMDTLTLHFVATVPSCQEVMVLDDCTQ